MDFALPRFTIPSSLTFNRSMRMPLSSSYILRMESSKVASACSGASRRASAILPARAKVFLYTLGTIRRLVNPGTLPAKHS